MTDNSISESTRNKEKHRACETETPGTMQAEVLEITGPGDHVTAGATHSTGKKP